MRIFIDQCLYLYRLLTGVLDPAEMSETSDLAEAALLALAINDNEVEVWTAAATSFNINDHPGEWIPLKSGYLFMGVL
jgi:hypothetical protein